MSTRQERRREAREREKITNYYYKKDKDNKDILTDANGQKK